MAGRKTKPITFNLADRGRKFTGQDRRNVDLKTWIDLINSPATQEMVNTGSMLGYYGHQIRMLFGVNPPETAFVAGKQVSISPAVRTIELYADEQGNVTHRAEFLETPEGEHSLQKYKAKIGGFSGAYDYSSINGTVLPTQVAGMDYVLQPNYVHNAGDGVLLDGVIQNDFVRQTVEMSLLEMYDSIHQTNYAVHMAESNLMRAIESENRLIEFQQQQERRKRLVMQKEANLYDSALCPTVSIDEYMQQGRAFIMDGVTVHTNVEPKPQDDKFKGGFGLLGLFG